MAAQHENSRFQRQRRQERRQSDRNAVFFLFNPPQGAQDAKAHAGKQQFAHFSGSTRSPLGNVPAARKVPPAFVADLIGSVGQAIRLAAARRIPIVNRIGTVQPANPGNP